MNCSQQPLIVTRFFINQKFLKNVKMKTQFDHPRRRYILKNEIFFFMEICRPIKTESDSVKPARNNNSIYSQNKSVCFPRNESFFREKGNSNRNKASQ